MNTFSYKEASSSAGIPVSRLKRLVVEGKILLENGQVPESYVLRLQEEARDYQSLPEYAASHSSERFDGDSRTGRLLLLETLEKEQWFGIPIKEPAAILRAQEADIAYFHKDYLPVLEEGLAEFFEFVGLDPKEEAEKWFEKTGGHDTSKRLLHSFFQEEVDGTLNASHASLARVILSAPDLPAIDDNALPSLLGQAASGRTRKLVIRFLNYAKENSPVRYSFLCLETGKGETAGRPAYPDDVYIGLGRCLFSPEYIYENRMVEKALQDHMCAEAWLYTVLFYVCGWRAQDVCRGWKYPRLSENAPYFGGINPDTLYEDLLDDRISTEAYEEVCRYALAGVQASGMQPGKTASRNPPSLLLDITPEMHPFYGMLSLIGEYHHLKDPNTGYMRPNRAGLYQNRVRMKDFYGPSFWSLLKGENLETRRLNKDYLQGMEDTARKSGQGALRASTIASLFRSHINLESITAYLADHSLTGENAGMVLYTLFERGVFAFVQFQALVTAYPESFRLLPMEKQTELIRALDMTPLQVEAEAAGALAASQSVSGLIRGVPKDASSVLEGLFEIAQGKGQAKDAHCYCILRARGCACENPTYASCIASGCEYLIITRYGLKPLLDVLRSYWDKREAGDKKAGAVLGKLMQRYWDLLNALARQDKLSPEEKAAIKRITVEAMK